MVRTSLNNPYAVVAVCLIVVLLGIVSYQKMTVDIFPEIKVPVVAVATFYKGMGPNEIEGAITLRLEQLFLQASYVEHIESRSLPGVSLIKIYFHPEYNVDAGLSEITSLTYSALRFMPKGMFHPRSSSSARRIFQSPTSRSVVPVSARRKCATSPTIPCVRSSGPCRVCRCHPPSAARSGRSPSFWTVKKCSPEGSARTTSSKP